MNAAGGDGGGAAGDGLGEPFPLRRRFRRQVAPALALFVAALIATTLWATRSVLESIYLEQAERQAGAIAESASAAVPQAWAHLLAGTALTGSDFRALADALEKERAELHLSQLKVYDLEGRTLYSDAAPQIGEIEENEALNEVLVEGEPALRLDRQPDGTELYELYVPYVDADGHVRAVFELYEPVTYLDGVLLRAAIPVVGVPGLMLLALVVALAMLVGRAQADIDRRTALIDSLRQRLERFVSRRAIDAIRGEADVAAMPAETLQCTLLFSDIRGFTRYAEEHTPEAVIEMLNRAMQMQVDAIEAEGGDVDKMIGDAVFARFHGAGRAASALRAAQEIQLRAAAAELPLGIGVYSGPVITGAIGVGQRFDYTTIGDSVNVASRLCSAAVAGETIVDMDTLDAAGPEISGVFDEAPPLTVKGRQQQIRIARALGGAGT